MVLASKKEPNENNEMFQQISRELDAWNARDFSDACFIAFSLRSPFHGVGFDLTSILLQMAACSVYGDKLPIFCPRKRY